jgi:hypothetical protein
MRRHSPGRWRLGLAEDESKYDDLEKRFAGSPMITVPTTIVQSDADGVPRPDTSSYAKKFSGRNGAVATPLF